MKCITYILSILVLASNIGLSETLSLDDLVVRKSLYYKKFTNEVGNGSIETYYESGQMKAIGELVNGAKEGPWEEYIQKDKEKFIYLEDYHTGSYHKNKKIGIWKVWGGDFGRFSFDPAKPYKEIRFDDAGKLIGENYFETDKDYYLKRSWEYVRNKENELIKSSKYFHDNGMVSITGLTKYRCKMFKDMFNVKEEKCLYLEAGPRKFYNRDGSLQKTQIYKDGELVNTIIE